MAVINNYPAKKEKKKKSENLFKQIGLLVLQTNRNSYPEFSSFACYITEDRGLQTSELQRTVQLLVLKTLKPWQKSCKIIQP